jgi:hypothetical protein
MIVLPRQARDKQSLGKALKRKRRFLADPALLCNQGAAAWYGNCLFRHCIDYSNLEHLPRQARDKHEGNALKQKDVSSAGIAGLLVAAVLGSTLSVYSGGLNAAATSFHIDILSNALVRTENAFFFGAI